MSPLLWTAALACAWWWWRNRYHAPGHPLRRLPEATRQHYVLQDELRRLEQPPAPGRRPELPNGPTSTGTYTREVQRA